VLDRICPKIQFSSILKPYFKKDFETQNYRMIRML